MSPFTVYPTRLLRRPPRKLQSFCMTSCFSIEWVESSSIGVSGLPSNPPTDAHAFWCASDKLRANILLKQYFLEVDLRHVGLYNDELAHAIQDRPTDVLPLVRQP